MTNFNSGFNSNYNPNLNPNYHAGLFNRLGVNQQNPNINNPNNPYTNTVNQPFIQQNAEKNAQIAKQNLLSEEAAQTAQTEGKTPIYNKEMAKMDSEVLIKYLQNVMKMPENVNKLLSTLDSPIIKALVEKSIDVKILSEILKTNSQDAIERVLKAISESIKSGAKDISQLKDVLGILNTVQNSSPNNAIKELLLLYIPVNPPIFDKNVDFKSGNAGEEEALSASDFCLIFETINFSNISCCINSYDNTLYVQTFADKNFPFDKFNKVINNFKKEMSLRIETENKFVKRVENDKERIRNFNVLTTGFVPFDVLILSHLIVKTIFKIDETFQAT